MKNHSKWEKTRIATLERAGYACEKCGAQKERKEWCGLAVHHRNGKRGGVHDNPDNLQALCKACHRKLHVETGLKTDPEHEGQMPMNIRLPRELHEKLKTLAEAHYLTRGRMIGLLIREAAEKDAAGLLPY